MVKLRKAVAYRRVERPYTRRSKFRKLSYVRAIPQIKIPKFETGNLQKKFDYTLELRSKKLIQIRHNALESARKSSNRWLEKKLGKDGYKLKIVAYPHHILRENPLTSGAGADRMSTGMKMSFGKPIGLAAQVKVNQIIVSCSVNEAGLQAAKEAMDRARHKMPCGCRITRKKNTILA
ncbi:MAG: 50S ribosomal protein L16 [Candidatus Woesearchaeota archaeon]